MKFAEVDPRQSEHSSEHLICPYFGGVDYRQRSMCCVLECLLRLDQRRYLTNELMPKVSPVAVATWLTPMPDSMGAGRDSDRALRSTGSVRGVAAFSVKVPRLYPQISECLAVIKKCTGDDMHHAVTAFQCPLDE